MNSHAAIFVIFLIFNLVVSACPAQTAFLKSSEILEGDIAVLVVEFENEVPSLFPLDTTPLQTDFEVLQVKPSLLRKPDKNNVANIMHWEVELFPKNTGYMNIPPLNIKGALTPELGLEVKPRNEQNDDGTKIYIETTVTQGTPYLGQQIIVSLRLFHNRPLSRGILFDLELEGSDFYPLGADKRYRQIIEGENFTVLHRKLAVFANRPGPLTIPAVEFRGELEGQSERRIKRTGTPFEVNILPPARDYQGADWLPAGQLEVLQQWFHVDQVLTVGDTISRKITLRATGLPASALPETLFPDDNEQFNVYADQAQRSDLFSDTSMTGVLEQTHAIVFTASGDIDFPDIQISWWDVDDDIEKSALLPGLSLNIAEPARSPAAATQRLTDRSDSSNNILWITLTITSLLTIAIALRLFRPSVSNPASFSRRKLKQACFQGDARGARRLLISWASIKIPRQAAPGLYDLIAATESATLKQQLKALDSAIYGPDQSPWQGKKLWSSFVKHSPSIAKADVENSPELPDLYRA